MLRRPLGILSKTCPKSRIPRKSLTSTVYSLVSRILQSAGHPKPANDKTRDMTVKSSVGSVGIANKL